MDQLFHLFVNIVVRQITTYCDDIVENFDPAPGELCLYQWVVQRGFGEMKI